jgi:hypothetical protein
MTNTNQDVKIVQTLTALALVVVSLYTSVKYASCGDKKVVIPNHINLILGAIGLVFALCTCCVAEFSKFEFGTVVVLPGIAVVVDCLVMMSAGCEIKEDTKDGQSNTEELKKDPLVAFELFLGLLMAGLGMWDVHRRTFKLRKI